MLRLAIYAVLLSTVFIYTYVITAVALYTLGTPYVFRPIVSNTSYLYEIKTDPVRRVFIKESLDKFNSFGHNEILGINPISYFSRPISITTKAFTWDYEQNLMAYTFSDFTKCEIYVRTDLSVTKYESTVIHELLHCYGFGHSPIVTDVMYFMDNPTIDINSALPYIQEIEKWKL